MVIMNTKTQNQMMKCKFICVGVKKNIKLHGTLKF
jgi:hypothetical protein